jgi:hypothetical protein
VEPVVSPVNVQPVEAPVSAWKQDAGAASVGADVTLNPVMAEPPSDAGAVQEMTADVDVVVALAVTPVGAPGTVGIETEADAELDALVEKLFVAVTEKV